jgi:hypothetical protein
MVRAHDPLWLHLLVIPASQALVEFSEPLHDVFMFLLISISAVVHSTADARRLNDFAWSVGSWRT